MEELNFEYVSINDYFYKKIFIYVDVKEIIKVARKHIKEIFEEENISNLGLEEVSYDDTEDLWKITIGFSRPWDYKSQSILPQMSQNLPTRDYKVVKITNEGKVIEIVNRD